MTPLAQLLEAALFASGMPIGLDALLALDLEATPDLVLAALAELRARYDDGEHGIEVVEAAGGWQILTRPEYTAAIERAQIASRPHRLSAAALETLALIAYRQPITRADIEEIRADADFHWVTVSFPRPLAPFVIHKGSVAVDGVSLTVAGLGVDRFDIQIVPFTMQHTNLGRAQIRDRVNLECDMVGKYVVRAAELAGLSFAALQPGEVTH